MVEDQQIKELIEKMDQLIKALKDQGKFNYFNIHHADIQGPLVDKLEYTFDKLDVKEVNGALNLGTTFGVRVAEKKKKSDMSSTKTERESEASKQNRAKQSGGFTKTGSHHAQNSPGSTSHTNNTQSQRASSKSRTDDSQQVSRFQSSKARALVSEKSKQAQKAPEEKTIKTNPTPPLEPQSQEKSTRRKRKSKQVRQEKIKKKEKKNKTKGTGQTLEQPQEMGAPNKERRETVKISFHKQDHIEIEKAPEDTLEIKAPKKRKLFRKQKGPFPMSQSEKNNIIESQTREISPANNRWWKIIKKKATSGKEVADKNMQEHKNQECKETQEQQEEHKAGRPFSYTKNGFNVKLK